MATEVVILKGDRITLVDFIS